MKRIIGEWQLPPPPPPTPRAVPCLRLYNKYVLTCLYETSLAEPKLNMLIKYHVNATNIKHTLTWHEVSWNIIDTATSCNDPFIMGVHASRNGQISVQFWPSQGATQDDQPQGVTNSKTELESSHGHTSASLLCQHSPETLVKFKRSLIIDDS